MKKFCQIALVATILLVVSDGASAQLGKGVSLQVNQTMQNDEFLSLDNYTLVMQMDCNLVFYNPSKVVEGSSNTMTAASTGGRHGCLVKMQDDCNLVILNGQGKAIWATGTNKIVGADCPTVQLTIIKFALSKYAVVIADASSKPLWQIWTSPYQTVSGL